MSFIKKTLAGIGCLTAGIGQILLICLSLGIHFYTIYISFYLGGVLWGILTIFLPPLSEIFWFIILWAKCGFFNTYTYAILAYIALILMTLFGTYLISSASEHFKE